MGHTICDDIICQRLWHIANIKICPFCICYIISSNVISIAKKIWSKMQIKKFGW